MRTTTEESLTHCNEIRLRADTEAQPAIADLQNYYRIALPPLVPGNWSWLPGTKAHAVVASIANKVSFPRHGFHLPEPDQFTAVRVRPLLFGEGGRMIDVCLIQQPAGPAAAWSAFCGADETVQLITGDSGWIHASKMLATSRRGQRNRGARDDDAEAPAVLRDQSAAADYLRFFCGAVWGDAGPFRIVETPDDPTVAGARQPGAKWKSAIRPLACQIHPDMGSVLISATVLYGRRLFRALFDVAPSGFVTMLSDAPASEEVWPTYDLGRRPLWSIARDRTEQPG